MATETQRHRGSSGQFKELLSLNRATEGGRLRRTRKLGNMNSEGGEESDH